MRQRYSPRDSLQMDDRFGVPRLEKAARKANAANIAPALVERIFPVDDAHGAAFFPGVVDFGGGGVLIRN